MMKRLTRAAILYGATWLACLALYWGGLATGALATFMYGLVPAAARLAVGWISQPRRAR